MSERARERENQIDGIRHIVLCYRDTCVLFFFFFFALLFLFRTYFSFYIPAFIESSFKQAFQYYVMHFHKNESLMGIKKTFSFPFLGSFNE